METIKAIAAALLILLSGSTFAGTTTDSNFKKEPRIKPLTFASPTDIDIEDIEALKEIPPVPVFPEMNFGTPADINWTEIESLKDANGEWPIFKSFIAGSPQDINFAEIEDLKNVQ